MEGEGIILYSKFSLTKEDCPRLDIQDFFLSSNSGTIFTKSGHLFGVLLRKEGELRGVGKWRLLKH